LVTTLALATAAAGSAAAQSTVKVGMVMPLTGTLATAGKQVVAGARLYISQHGDTVAGKKIELIVKDDTSSFEVGKRLIQELIVNDKVDVIGGGTTGDLLASAQIVTEARTVRTTFRVSYQSEPMAGVLLPVEMRETYVLKGRFYTLEGAATYSNFETEEDASSAAWEIGLPPME